MSTVLFWDFDGTLTHSNHLWSGAVHRCLNRVSPGHSVSLDQVRQVLRTGFTWHKPEEDYTHMTGEAWWDYMIGHFTGLYIGFGLEREAAREASLLVRREIVNPSNYTVYEDAVPVLQASIGMGYRNHLLSNNYPELEQIMGLLGLSGYFSGYTVSAVVGFEKPRREIFEHALAAAGFPDKAVMIGDNPVADMGGGAAMGMQTILVHNRADCPCTYRFDDLAGILGVLEAL